MNHTQLLNHLAAKYNLNSYLEVGVQNPANNFGKINCSVKYGVDPDPTIKHWKVFNVTSDVFFEFNSVVKLEQLKAIKAPTLFDLIFIDGLHHADQVQKDFENSLKCLNDSGFIVIHDTCPDEEQYTIVPRETKKWFGDVYKFTMTLGRYWDAINFVTLDIDCGCTIVWKGESKQFIKGISKSISWDGYQKHSKEYMRIIDVNELDKYLPNVQEWGILNAQYT